MTVSDNASLTDKYTFQQFIICEEYDDLTLFSLILMIKTSVWFRHIFHIIRYPFIAIYPQVDLFQSIQQT